MPSTMAPSAQIIGHEISHGFDDQGSQYDGDGKLLTAPGWFTQADLEHFKARTQALVQQYAAYSARCRATRSMAN